MIRSIIFMLVLLTAVPAFAGPGVRGVMRAGIRCLPSVLHEVTVTAPTGEGWNVLPTWYSDSCLQNPGMQIDLYGGGGGGAYGVYGNGVAGAHVVTAVPPGEWYDIWSGNGGAGGSSVGATVNGGTGYTNGANGTSYGAGGGSAAVTYDGALVAQAKGGNSAGGQLGGGTSSGGAVFPQEGAIGGAQGGAGLDGYPGSNGSVVIRYYTAP